MGARIIVFIPQKRLNSKHLSFAFWIFFVCPCGNYVIISLSNEKEASLNRHERITGIDAFKVLAMFAVIFLHAHSFHYSFEIYGLKLFKYLALIVGGTCSIAVPYFITASGYLFGRSLEGEKDAVRLAKKRCARLLPIYVFWVAFYGVFSGGLTQSIVRHGFTRGLAEGIYHNLLRVAAFAREHPLDFILRGTSGHLWFLTALMLSVMAMAFFISAKNEKIFLSLAFIIYVISLLVTCYSKTVIGLPFSFPVSIYRIFSSPIFLVMGYMFSKRKGLGLKAAVIISSVGYLLLFLEICLLYKLFNTPVMYYFSTLLFVAGMFQLSIALKDRLNFRIVIKLRELILGIYVFHMFILDKLTTIRGYFNPLFWDLSLPLTVFVLSMLGVLILKSFSPARKFVC